MADFLKHDIIGNCKTFLIFQIHSRMYGITICICINLRFIQNSSDTVLDANGIRFYFGTFLLHSIFYHYISGCHPFCNLLHRYRIMSSISLLIFLFVCCFTNTQNRAAIHNFYHMLLTFLGSIVSLGSCLILHLFSIQEWRRKLHLIKNLYFIFIRQVFPCFHRKSLLRRFQKRRKFFAIVFTLNGIRQKFRAIFLQGIRNCHIFCRDIFAKLCNDQVIHTSLTHLIGCFVRELLNIKSRRMYRNTTHHFIRQIFI